jgi:hypothetical protein
VEFIGEIEISEDDLSKLCPSVGKYLERAGWDEDIRAALAVAVVNLAFYSSEETGLGSFRWLALQKLLGHYLEDDQRWQREVGEPVLRLLKEYFHAEDTGTAFRFVSPIMQQAGVPAKLGRRFAQFLVRLLQSYGHNFSANDYKACCIEFEDQMSTAKKFLTSAQGQQYCRDIIKKVRYVEEGMMSEEQVGAHSFRFRNKVRQVLEMLRSNPHTALRRTDSLPAPRLALDRENLRLVIEFSEKGLDGAYRWPDGTKIRTARYILRTADFLGTLRFKSVQPHGQTEFPPIEPWRPAQNSWAAFRTTDGSFEQAAGDLRSGRHLLVISEPHSIPEQYVVEELGELYVPGQEQLIVRVFDCELPAEFSLPELNLSVIGGSHARVPALRFSERQWPVMNTSNVFVGGLPEITIENWDTNFADIYMIIQEENSRGRVVPESLYRDRDTFRMEAKAPTQGRIYLEPRGRTPRGFAESALRYVLLPEFKVTWPRGLHEADEKVSIGLEPATKIRVEWQPSSVVQAAESVWEVPPRLDFVSAQVSYADSVSFFIAGPIDRFNVKGDAVIDQVLWNEHLKQRAKISLSVSAVERGNQIELGLADADGFLKVIDLGHVPRNRQLIVSTDDVRDAFDGRGCPAGRIAVRTRGARIVRSDVTYLHEGLIAQRIFEDCEDEFNRWSQVLPEDLRCAVEGVRGMCCAPVSPFSLPDRSVPQSLRKFLSFYDLCGRVIDWGLTADGSEDRSDVKLRESLDWYTQVRNFIDGGISSDPHAAKRLLKSRPRKSAPFNKAQGTPALRWRVQLAHQLRRLRTLADVKRKAREDMRKVREWNVCCRDQCWKSAADCEIVRVPGGAALTRAAEDYHYGLDVLATNNHEKANEYLSSADNNVRKALEEAHGEGLVKEVALALQAMIYYHYKHEQFDVKASEVIMSLGDHWGRFKKTLRQMSGVQGDEEEPVESLRLSHFSPHRRDVEIEEQINQ